METRRLKVNPTSNVNLEVVAIDPIAMPHRRSNHALLVVLVSLFAAKTTATIVKSGAKHSCALMSDDTVMC